MDRSCVVYLKNATNAVDDPLATVFSHAVCKILRANAAAAEEGRGAAGGTEARAAAPAREHWRISSCHSCSAVNKCENNKIIVQTFNILLIAIDRADAAERRQTYSSWREKVCCQIRSASIKQAHPRVFARINTGLGPPTDTIGDAKAQRGLVQKYSVFATLGGLARMW
jgi:hypothetical protein